MITIANEVFSAIDDRDDLTSKKVSILIGASKQCMTKLKDDNTIGFRKLLRLSFLLFPAIQKSKMAMWCLRLTSVENIKQSFEYAAITRDLDLLKTLLNLHNKESGVIGEYVLIYSIIYRYMIREISGLNLMDYIGKVKQPKDKPLQVLIKIIECYNLYFDRDFLLMQQVANSALRMLAKLSDGRELFLKECFLHRLAEVLGPVNLHLNNLKYARYFASIIINANICPKTVSDASYIVGMSYLLENPSKCIEHLQTSYDISIGVGELESRDARMNLDLAKLYLGIKLEKDSHPALLHLEETEKCDGSIVKEASFQEVDEDFLLLFEVIASGSIERMYGCFETFFSQSNIFFASLSLKELQKNGENSFLTDKLIYFKLGKEGDVYFEENFISCFNNFNTLRRSVCV
jgi:hypothetical protein